MEHSTSLDACSPNESVIKMSHDRNTCGHEALYTYIIIEKKHHMFRHRITDTAAQRYAALGLTPEERMSERFMMLTHAETPVILPDERICFTRTVENLPPLFTDDEWKDICSSHDIHESGFCSNLCPDYEKVIAHGLLSYMDKADFHGRRVIESLLKLVERYELAARKAGRTDLADTLVQVPRYGARTFREALQSFRILNYALWLEGNYHNGIGRLDQYLSPYLISDLEAGRLTETEALDLVEEFFLTFNRDSDLYPGVQQGDNGQSLMLGGLLPDGTDGFNLLSELCLAASRNLKLIDPKINIRVNKNTPDRVYTLCSELTKAGLGFPQYSNDDVVIPGLLALGYDLADACQYTVAACWEFIIPCVGRDVANIAALSFPQVIDTCLHRDLPDCVTMDQFLAAVRQEVLSCCDILCSKIDDLWFIPSHLINLLMSPEDDKACYRNFGMHGVGLSTASDSLTAIARYVFGDHTVSADRLIHAVDTDFANDPHLLHLLRYETPKLGNHDNEADKSLCFLLDVFADALKGRKNCWGGLWRPGTGSAMYYLWSAQDLGASPDGRRAGEPFAANYSISLFARPDGPLSLIMSMTRPDLSRVINGGPLTLEFHNSLFNSAESVEQVGQFVKTFILLGGHQLQLNAVNKETLLDAQANPEKYAHLIVRIWGWSAYFTELDRVFQDHVIARQAYRL